MILVGAESPPERAVADMGGPLLVRAGLISQAQLVAALAAKRSAGGTLSEHLVAAGAVDEERLCNFFRERLLVPRVGLAELSRIPSRVIARIPQELAAEFHVVPLDFDREQNLILAMADPSDTHAIDEIGFFTGAFVMRAVAPPSAIAWALAHYYGIETPLLERSRGIARGTPARPLTPPPVEVTETPSGAVVLVDHAPAPKVVVASQEPEPAPPPESYRVLPPAQIVEDVYGEDTPLPGPVPFDVTGQVPRLEELPPPTAEAAIPGAVPVPVAAPGGDTVKIPVPPMPAAAAPAPPEIDADAALTAVLDELRFASDRDTVAATLVAYLARLCQRAAFFVVKKGELVGWMARAPGVRQEELRQVTLPLASPSTFRDIVQMRLAFRGPVMDTTSRDFLIDALGWAPSSMLVAPVTLRDKVVGLLYGDEDRTAIPDEDLGQVARVASQALERALAVKKGQM